MINIKKTKEMWDNLISIYEGDDKVKKTKLQNFRRKFESLKMNEEKYISTYFLQLYEVVDYIKGLCEDIKEMKIV